MEVAIFGSLIIHTVALISAYFTTGIAHILSDRGIFAILKESFEVRWISIYLIDVAPIYLALFIFLSWNVRRYRRTKSLHFYEITILSLTTAVLTLIAHQFLFPLSTRATFILVLFALLHASIYAFLIYFFRAYQGPDNSALQHYWPACRALIIGTLISVVFVGGFKLAYIFGLPREAETYVSSKTKNGQIMDYRDPVAKLFRVVETNIDGTKLASAVVVDLDGNRRYDLVVKDTDGRLRAWMNKPDGWKEDPTSLPDPDLPVNAYSFSGTNSAGHLDLLVSVLKGKPESTLENSFLKFVYWYPWPKPAAVARLFRRGSSGGWQDVTATAFPKGIPWAYRKVEPITWIDVNSDGHLDFVWSGYPHPRHSMNRLYLNQGDGTFVDGIRTHIKWLPGRIYPEGTDVGDLDGDGDVDLFAYGYPFINNNGIFRQLCAKMWAKIPCDAEARLEEGGVFEDVDGDGKLEFVISYHGIDGELKKYTILLFRYSNGKLVLDQKASSKFYGIHYYLRGKDVDGDGKSDLLTRKPGRLLFFRNGRWVDALPVVEKQIATKIDPIGWIDADGDGDWDILARRDERRVILLQNQLNPHQVLRLNVRGRHLQENQPGATISIRQQNGRTYTASLRGTGGYGATTDPSLMMPMKKGATYEIRACFVQSSRTIKSPFSAIDKNFSIEFVGRDSQGCRLYRLNSATKLGLLQVELLAGSVPATISFQPLNSTNKF